MYREVAFAEKAGMTEMVLKMAKAHMLTVGPKDKPLTFYNIDCGQTLPFLPAKSSSALIAFPAKPENDGSLAGLETTAPFTRNVQIL